MWGLKTDIGFYFGRGIIVGDLLVIASDGRYVLLQETATEAFIRNFNHLYDAEGSVYCFQKIDSLFMDKLAEFDFATIEEEEDRGVFKTMFGQGKQVYMGHNISFMASISLVANMPPILAEMEGDGCDLHEAQRRIFERLRKKRAEGGGGDEARTGSDGSV